MLVPLAAEVARPPGFFLCGSSLPALGPRRIEMEQSILRKVTLSEKSVGGEATFYYPLSFNQDKNKKKKAFQHDRYGKEELAAGFPSVPSLIQTSHTLLRRPHFHCRLPGRESDNEWMTIEEQEGRRGA